MLEIQLNKLMHAHTLTHTRSSMRAYLGAMELKKRFVKRERFSRKICISLYVPVCLTDCQFSLAVRR